MPDVGDPGYEFDARIPAGSFGFCGERPVWRSQ